MAVDYFLKIDGIEGESQDHKHKSEIDIQSWSWGATQTGTHAAGGGGGAGRVDFRDFTFLKQVDKASPKLMLNCATGKHIKSAVLTCRKAGGGQQEYMKVTFSDVLISSYQPSGAASEMQPLPQEEIAFNFGKIEVEYREQKPDGTLGGAVSAGYDLKLRKGA
ncbi:MAG: type VI secretion system tube protein Hcp [Acidobacteriales bacterium]|nr:MAG: type VI secretion system tube protein Hcp [Terriglobales bacterium]